MATVLLIDDDREVLAINKTYLSQEGFTVHTSDHPRDGLRLAQSVHPDCIVLDVMMPEINGIELCAKLKEYTQAPIILLSGCTSEDDRITGLTSGAEDYMLKPYSLRELKARIDLQLRRSRQLKASAAVSSNTTKQKTPSTTLVIGNLKIDRLAHKAFYFDEDLHLANREFEVLSYMAEHPNREITFEELGTMLFGSYQELDRRSVMVNVSRLRKKFEGNHELENHIETVWSKGYRFLP